MVTRTDNYFRFVAFYLRRGVVISQPHLDRLSVIRVPVCCDDWVSHELTRDWAGELIPERGARHLLRLYREFREGRRLINNMEREKRMNQT